MKFLEFAFKKYKKHDTLGYVTFLYSNSPTVQIKQNNLHDVFFINKRHDTMRYIIFHGIFEIVGGWEAFL